MAARLDDIKVRNDGLSLLHMNVEAADLDHHWQRLANGEMSPVDLAAQMPHKCFENTTSCCPRAFATAPTPATAGKSWTPAVRKGPDWVEGLAFGPWYAMNG